jgi:hypothetical protein
MARRRGRSGDLSTGDKVAIIIALVAVALGVGGYLFDWYIYVKVP